MRHAALLLRAVGAAGPSANRWKCFSIGCFGGMGTAPGFQSLEQAGGRSGHSFVCRVLQDTTSSQVRPSTSSRSRDSWFQGWPPQRHQWEVLRSHHPHPVSGFLPCLTFLAPWGGEHPRGKAAPRPAAQLSLYVRRWDRSRGRPKTQDLKIRRSNKRQEKRDQVRPCEIVYNFRYKMLQSHPSTAK